MKWIVALMVSVMALCAAQAAGPDDQYLEIYNIIQQADGLSKANDARNATAQYLQAQAGLKKLQTVYPTWNPEIIKFRLEYVSECLAALEKTLPRDNAPASATPSAPKPATTAELQQQIADLAEQLRTVVGEKATLEKKLKEALSVQPVTADTNALAQAEKEILALKKERDLMSASWEAEKAARTKGKEKQNTDAEAAKLAKERESLLAQLSAAQAANAQLNEQLTKATQELKSLKSTSEQVQATQNEKARLERECADLKEKLKAKEAKEAKRTGGEAQAGEIEQLRARVAVLEATPAPYSAEELALIKNAEPRVLPLPAPAPAATGKKMRSAKDLPPGAGALMADAQRSYSAGEYETAEKKYAEVLRQDDKNVYVLSHLANAQFAANHYDECEKSIQKALSIDPEDAASLYLLGNLRMRQNKPDEALDALSRSASFNPTNAATQNSLASVLSQKGLRQPAEAALRKALQLAPDFPEAHRNLAFVYATQKPPFLELARWHYKKATDLGHPRDPELEKLLETAPAASATPAAAPAPSSPEPAPATNAPATPAPAAQ